MSDKPTKRYPTPITQLLQVQHSGLCDAPMRPCTCAARLLLLMVEVR